jgi:glucokinase
MSERGGYIGGVDLGGTKILSVVVDARLAVVASDLRATEATEGPEAVIERLVESITLAAHGRPLRAVGIATPGPSDPDRGIVTTPPNLPGWRNVPLARLVSERLGLPAWLENDANAAAMAEFELGAGKDANHMVLVTLGTGIGGGLILNGKLYRGATGGAGEVGHMQLVPDGPRCGCRRHGCLEALASGRALAARALEIIAEEPDGILAQLAAEEERPPSARTLQRAADQGDGRAEGAIRLAGRYLGAGLTNLVNVFNPEVLAIGGNLRKLGERYLGEALQVVKAEAFQQHLSNVRIVETELEEEVGAIGAAIVALERLAAQPGAG